MKTYDPYDLEGRRMKQPVDADGIPYMLSQDYAKAKATEQDLAIVVPDNYTLQLDIDSDANWEDFRDRLAPAFIEHVEVSWIWWTTSKSGNKHVYVRLKKEVTAYERIALQASLGSDPLRELLSALRICVGNIDMPTLFFEKKTGLVETVIYATDGYQPSQKMLTAGDDDNSY